MFEKIALLKECFRLPSVFITGESIMNMNNSRNIQKNLILFLDMPIRTRRSCLKKKIGDEKSRDTVPLMNFWCPGLVSPPCPHLSLVWLHCSISE
jgi:hypothetical protein